MRFTHARALNPAALAFVPFWDSISWGSFEFQSRLAHFNLPAAFTEWAPLAQDRAGWRKLVTKPPFKLGKPFVRQPRGDTRVTPEDKQRLAKERAAEIARRRADFNATIN